MKRIMTTTLLVLAMAAGSGAGEIVTVDGVTHVRNGAEPSGGVETMELRELWRAGGEDDDVFFGLITQVVVGDDGRIYLLDTQLSEVRVYSPDGENLGTLSREGDGPGEVRGPVDLFFTPEGNLGLMQTFPGKIVIIDTAGDPVDTYTPGGNEPAAGGFLVLQDAMSYGDDYLMCGISISQTEPMKQTRTSFLSAFDAEGNETVKYLEKVDHWDLSNFTLSELDQYFVNFRRWTVGGDGRVYGAPERNDYRIHVMNPDGGKDRIIEREYAPMMRDERAMSVINNAMDAARQQFGPLEIKTEVEKTEPVFRFPLHVAQDGSLWVLPSRGALDQPEGVMCTFDVFDPEGRFAKQVQVLCEGDGEDDGFIFAGPDRVVVVTGFMDAVLAIQGGGAQDDEEEPEPMSIICYAID